MVQSTSAVYREALIILYLVSESPVLVLLLADSEFSALSRVTGASSLEVAVFSVLDSVDAGTVSTDVFTVAETVEVSSEVSSVDCI